MRYQLRRLFLVVCAMTLVGSKADGQNASNYTSNSTGTSLQRALKDRFADVAFAKDYGVVCDGSTDTTSALQSAITGNQLLTASGSGRILILPSGVCISGPLTISGQIRLSGQSSSASVLRLKSGSTAPLLTVATQYSGTNYYAGGEAPATVVITNLRLDSPSNSDPSGANVAHGILVANATSNAVYAKVVIEDVTISHMPADGLSGSGFTGFVVADRLYLIGNGRNNLYANSDYDWRITSSEFSEAKIDNISMNASNGFKFTTCNSYAPGRYNLYLTQAGTDGQPGLNDWTGGAIDGAQQHNVYYDIESPASPFRFSETNINNPSNSSYGVYSDIYLSANANGNLILNNVYFDHVYSSGASGSKAKYNVEFDTASPGNNVVVMNNAWIQDQPYSAFNRPYAMIGSFYVSNVGQTVNRTTTALEVTAPFAEVRLTDPTAGTDAKTWAMQTNSTQLVLGSRNDAETSLTPWLRVYRSGPTPAFAEFENPVKIPSLILTGTLSAPAYDYEAPTNGFSVSAAASIASLVLDPATTLSSGSITLPAGPSDGQVFSVTSSRSITGLSVSPASGQTLHGAPTSLSSIQGHAWMFVTSKAAWFEMY